jgi:hypothetical protein
LIKESEKYKCDTQYRTENKQKNGRLDLVIESHNEIFFIENKINNSRLTSNQPKGYLKELAKLEDYQKKHLYFIIPGYYSHIIEIENNLKKYGNINIHTKILKWEKFFEEVKKDDFTKTSVIYSEFFQLLKEWFGYDHIALPKKGEIKMNVKEFGKELLKYEHSIYTIKKIISSNGFITKLTKRSGEIGFDIFDKKDKPMGWFGIWNELWAAKGCIFIFVADDNDNSLFSKEFEYYDEQYKYLTLDEKILNGNFEEKLFVDWFLKEVLNKM